jgi:hypothetical protein
MNNLHFDGRRKARSASRLIYFCDTLAARKADNAATT